MEWAIVNIDVMSPGLLVFEAFPEVPARDSVALIQPLGVIEPAIAGQIICHCPVCLEALSQPFGFVCFVDAEEPTNAL